MLYPAIGCMRYGALRLNPVNNNQNRGPAKSPRPDSECVAIQIEVFAGGHMLRWALAFFVVALIAGFLGFAGVALAAAGIAKILFYLFLILFLVTLVGHLLRRT